MVRLHRAHHGRHCRASLALTLHGSHSRRAGSHQVSRSSFHFFLFMSFLPSVSQDVVTTSAALLACHAAVEHAISLGICINVAVTDASGAQLAFLRMNGAAPHAIDIAIDKAHATANFGFKASPWPEILAGGLPIMAGDSRLGGIGVSGAGAEQDAACAQAGLSALRITPFAPGQ